MILQNLLERMFTNYYCPKKFFNHYTRNWSICEKQSEFGRNFFRGIKSLYCCIIDIITISDQCQKDLVCWKFFWIWWKEANCYKKGYCLNLDNWYRFPDLYNKLCQLKANVCGMVKINRKRMPKALESMKLKWGGSHYTPE